MLINLLDINMGHFGVVILYIRFISALVLFPILIGTSSFANATCADAVFGVSPRSIPDNIVVLETQLQELNDEFKRFHHNENNEEMSPDEIDEFLTQENTRYSQESDLRLIYMSRLNALRIKVVEKLTSLYLDHIKGESAIENVESLRRVLYSVILNTKIRSFNVESVKSINQISRNISRLLRLKESVGRMRNMGFQIRNAISEGDFAYVKEILSGLQIDYSIKIKKYNRKTIIAAADSAIADLNTIIETTVKEMDSLNSETIELLSAFSGLAPSFNAYGFQKWANHDNDRSYFDELIALANSFLPDKDRVSGCCGRPCGLTCPYLTRMDIPIPTLENLPSNPKLAVYRTLLIFREMVPNDVLPFPLGPSILRKQLKTIKDMDP